MKRQDDFELYHQRRKRRPLAEIRPDRNSENQLQSLVKGKPNSNNLQSNHRVRDWVGNTGKAYINTTKDSLRHGLSSIKKELKSKRSHGFDDFEEFGIAKYLNKENQSKGQPQPSKARKNSIWRDLMCSDSEAGTEIQAIPQKMKSRDDNHSRTRITSNWTSDFESNNGERYRLLSSLIDYNATVEKSNKVIRSFCDSMKLNSASSKCLANDVVRSENLKVATVARVSKLGSLIEAITTSTGEEILLVNIHGTQISAGNKISLETPLSLDMSGISISVYSKWELV